MSCIKPSVSKRARLSHLIYPIMPALILKRLTLSVSVVGQTMYHQFIMSSPAVGLLLGILNAFPQEVLFVTV